MGKSALWRGGRASFSNTTARARHLGWTPRTRERFANHMPCPSIRIVDKRSVVHPTSLRTPLPTPRIGRVENGEAISTRYVQATSLPLRNGFRTKVRRSEERRVGTLDGEW